MAITAQVFSLALTKMGSNTLFGTSWTADTIKVALLNSTGATALTTGSNRDTYSMFSDVNTNELAATGGYSTGGVTVTSPSIGAVIATHKVPYIGVIPAWSAATFTAYAAVVYRSNGGVASTSPLICSIDFGGAQTVSSGTFTITADATNGIFNLAAS